MKNATHQQVLELKKLLEKVNERAEDKIRAIASDYTSKILTEETYKRLVERGVKASFDKAKENMTCNLCNWSNSALRIVSAVLRKITDQGMIESIMFQDMNVLEFLLRMLADIVKESNPTKEELISIGMDPTEVFVSDEQADSICNRSTMSVDVKVVSMGDILSALSDKEESADSPKPRLNVDDIGEMGNN